MFLKIIKNVGIWGYVAFCILALLFIFGESTNDPGDSNPYLVIAMCAVSAVVLLLLTFKKVRYLQPMFIALSIIAIAMSFATTFFPDWWGSFRNTNGPVLGVAILILSLALAIWARQESRIAGFLMVLITLAPLIAEMILIREIHLGGSTGALSVPGVIAGFLILLGSGTR